jgi:histidinol-phosphate/aromatic aminotransferase/cobyric acid decarboxylase-like protein/GNAT superfamily N-acetyltransferase
MTPGGPRTILSDMTQRFSVEQAGPADRERIYAMRHDVYAREIRQHAENAAGRLTDDLDAWNTYLVVRDGDAIAGFVSITPPGAPRWSVDKYFQRSSLPFAIDQDTYEVRLLTVASTHRGREVAFLLMYAALRWIESRGGHRVVAIGRVDVLPMYLDSGLTGTGLWIDSGNVSYELMHATTAALRAAAERQHAFVDRIERLAAWRLGMPFRKPAACFHGGAFFDAIGTDFSTLERTARVINADVLDAWFDPAPAVIHAVLEHLPWAMRTSPPTSCDGLVNAIAASRGVRAHHIVVGAGSSDLIFRALPRWLTRKSRALLLDPTYGEYAHVLEQVIGCRVDRLALTRDRNYTVPLDRLEAALGDGYDLVVLVNPNSPTGQHIPAADMKRLLGNVPAATRVWVDETYGDYAGAGESIEGFAASSENVIVCKSMSKAYALSGMRVAYLCGPAHQLEEVRSLTPPWAVSLPAQVAAVAAVKSHDYYRARWTETHALRQSLADGLRRLGCDVIDGVANFLLCHLPAHAPATADVLADCRARDLFIRDASPMGRSLGPRAIRLAVKDAVTNARMLALLNDALMPKAAASSLPRSHRHSSNDAHPSH